jgi:hypothetical protein
VRVGRQSVEYGGDNSKAVPERIHWQYRAAVAPRQSLCLSQNHEDAAKRIERRRRLNPIRDARRQAQLTRMLRRVIDHVPTYREITNGREVVAQVYTGHKAVVAR